MKLYFAGPLFCKSEREFNISLTSKIEEIGYDVFLPQRDGAEKDKSPYDKMSKEERRYSIFSIDRDKILECDVFLFILDGRVPDEGACVELGIAYTQKYLTNSTKTLIGFHSDIRAAFIGAKLNPMLFIPLDKIIDNEKILINTLKKILNNKTAPNISKMT